jgi:polyisoprenoid-binding protein YceI
MKNITGTFLLALFTLSSFGLAYYQLTERTIEPDYSLKFSTRSTDGTFSGLDGTVIFSPSDVENATIDVKLDAATIETGSNKKNEHVNSADWLDTEKYPEIRFTSSKFQKQGDTFIVDGAMTLHGVTKPVQVSFNYSEADGKFTGSFTINRSEYGVTGVGMKAKFVGEEIEITFNIPTSLKQ